MCPLSTGGGYIGGFWTAWRQQQPALTGRPGEPCFPVQTPAGKTRPRDIREPAPIRHLREFSRFLMPRLGFFHSETWAGIIAILGGLIPALLATLSLLVLMQYVWFSVAVWLATCPLECSLSFVSLTTFILQVACEDGLASFRQTG